MSFFALLVTIVLLAAGCGRTPPLSDGPAPAPAPSQVPLALPSPQPSASPVPQPSPTPLRVSFTVQGEVFYAELRQPESIAQARSLLLSRDAHLIPMGKVVAGSDGNSPWSWHLDPDSVHFVDVAMELCDGKPSYVEAHLADWIENVKVYCPWSARITGIE